MCAFASDIFLINESVKTESSCLFDFCVHKPACPHLVVLGPLAKAQEPTKGKLPSFLPGLLILCRYDHLGRAPGPVCGGVPQPQPQGYQDPRRNAQALVSTQLHAVPVRLLSMTFHSGKRERENTGHLGSLSPQISGASRSTTPSQRLPNLAGLQSHPCRLPRTATPMPIREGSPQAALQLEALGISLGDPSAPLRLRTAALGHTRSTPPGMQGVRAGPQSGMGVCQQLFP